jgi:hypothetical protein
MFALLSRTVLTYEPEKNVFGNMTTEGSYPSDAAPWLPSATRSLRSSASLAVALLISRPPGGNPGLAGVGRRATV